MTPKTANCGPMQVLLGTSCAPLQVWMQSCWGSSSFMELLGFFCSIRWLWWAMLSCRGLGCWCCMKGPTIVNAMVHQDCVEEWKQESEFWSVQEDILQKYSLSSPEPLKLLVHDWNWEISIVFSLGMLHCRCAISCRPPSILNIEWLPIKLTTASQYLQQRRASLDREINTEYLFQLVLHATAGTFPSNLLLCTYTHHVGCLRDVNVFWQCPRSCIIWKCENRLANGC